MRWPVRAAFFAFGWGVGVLIKNWAPEVFLSVMLCLPIAILLAFNAAPRQAIRSRKDRA